MYPNERLDAQRLLDNVAIDGPVLNAPLPPPLWRRRRAGERVSQRGRRGALGVHASPSAAAASPESSVGPAAPAPRRRAAVVEGVTDPAAAEVDRVAARGAMLRVLCQPPTVVRGRLRIAVVVVGDQHVARGRSDERRRSLIARSQVSPLVYQSRTGRFYSAGTEAFSGWVWCSG